MRSQVTAFALARALCRIGLEQNDRERGRGNRYQQRVADSGADFIAASRNVFSG